MIKINGILLGKIENTNDYLVYYTRRFRCVKLSDILNNINNIHTEIEGNDNHIIQLYNGVVDTQSSIVKFEDGVADDKHWRIAEVDGHYVADSRNVMVLGRIVNRYVTLQPDRSKRIPTLSNMATAKTMYEMNTKLKEAKLKLVNAKVVNSSKKTSSGTKQNIYVQSFAGGLHYIVEGKLKDIDDIQYLLSNIGAFMNSKSMKTVAFDNLKETCRILSGYKTGEIQITRDKLEAIWNKIVESITAVEEKDGIFSEIKSKEILDLVNESVVRKQKSLVENKAEQAGKVVRYATMDAIMQSIGKRCASAIEESPKQSGLHLTGKSVQYFSKDNIINNDKNLIMMAILRFDVDGETKYLLSRVVKDDESKSLNVSTYVTENDRATVLAHKTLSAKVEDMDSTKANLFCKKFRIRFSEITLEALKVLR